VPCFRPIQGYRTASGAFSMTLPNNNPEGFPTRMSVPCGQCIGCRIEQSRMWAVRITHEASQHSQNAFLTLTYRPEDLPSDGSLVKRHHQLFMKKLRKSLGKTPVRFFHCGEYGEQLQRPHYHTILFGYDFPDKVLWKELPSGRLYLSPTLENLWGHGFCTIGAVTVQSAAYVARYVTKKINGELAEDHYRKTDPVTGETHKIQPEYVTMSRRPGVAREWFRQFKTDVYPGDFVVINGKKYKTPRYYDKLLKEEDPLSHERIKEQRLATALAHAENNTPDRLAIREEVLERKTQLLKRGLESDPQSIHHL
jgi:hypothetical protein